MNTNLWIRVDLSIPRSWPIVNFELLGVDANLAKKVVASYEVSVKNFQLNDRTLTTDCTANTFRIFTGHALQSISQSINQSRQQSGIF